MNISYSHVHKQKTDSIAIDEHVLNAFIQRYRLHGISCTLYNFKQQKKNVLNETFLEFTHASRLSSTNFHKAD